MTKLQRRMLLRMLVLSIGYMASVSLMFVLRAVGGLTGALLAGVIYDVISADLLLASAQAVAAFTITIAPWWENALLLSIFIGLTGFSVAMVNVGVNFYCVLLWGDAHAPYLLFLVFLNNLAGAIIIPVARSLLIPKPHNQPNSHSATVSTSNESTYIINNDIPDIDEMLFNTPNISFGDEVTMPTNYPSITTLFTNGTTGSDDGYTWAARPYSPDDVKVQFAFLVPGVLFALASLIHTLLLLSNGCNLKPAFSEETNEGEGDETVENSQKLVKNQSKKTKRNQRRRNPMADMSRMNMLVLLVSFALLSGNSGSLDETYSMFLHSFLVKHLHWHKLVAAWPLLGLQVTIFLSQFAFIIVSKYLKPSRVMALLQAVMLVGAIVLCLPIHSHPFVIWTCTILSGIGVGPAGTTMVSWVSQSAGTSGKMTSFVFVCINISRMVTSKILGWLFDTNGPVWFIYINVITVGLSSLGFVATCFVTRNRSMKVTARDADDIDLGHPVFHESRFSPKAGDFKDNLETSVVSENKRQIELDET